MKNASGTEIFFGTLFFCNILLWKGKFLRKLRVTDSVETTMMHCIIRYIHERGEYKLSLPFVIENIAKQGGRI